MIQKESEQEELSPKDIVDILKIVLSSSMVLSFKIAVAHWNITWPNFLVFHPKFGDLYSKVFGTIDTVAERIRQLDNNTIKSLKEAIQYSIIREENKYKKDLEALDSIIEDIDAMLNLLYKAKEVSEEDLDTQQILIDLCMMYSQERYLLSSNK